jgi:hypothetical protein
MGRWTAPVWTTSILGEIDLLSFGPCPELRSMGPESGTAAIDSTTIRGDDSQVISQGGGQSAQPPSSPVGTAAVRPGEQAR